MDKWIPVSERLPEDSHGEYYDTVIITLKDKRVVAGNYVNRDKQWWGDITDGKYSNITDDVIAWMPLPEPYKGA